MNPVVAPVTAQVWIELRADDPAAVSAFVVARARLAAGHALRTLRRLRLLEVSGVLPGRDEIEALLHRSIQFYNPHKELCTVRLAASDAAPADADEVLVRVTDRDGERRPAAERWWRHQTEEPIAVRESVVWALRFEGVADPLAAAGELARLVDRHRGLLCNPHAQTMDVAAGEIPLPWIRSDAR